MRGLLTLNSDDVAALEQYMKEYAGNVEEAINDVLHNEASPLAQESIRNLIPVSGRRWKGKAPAAQTSNSLRSINANLSTTITTTKRYQYLYFPDDGSSTKRHAGDQQFFEKGGEAVKDEIIERCIGRLTNNFNKE